MIYLVATPIGNLEDITLRAINVLKSVDIIACEDTRTSQKLLTHYGISKKLILFHKFNEAASCEKILELDLQGKDVAIISDAGMPVISDPGNNLTKILRKNNVDFTVIPGANAALSALILSGLDASSFLFHGFLPNKKKERINGLQEISLVKSTLIFYIPSHDLEKDLQDIYSVFGARKCALVKEITKIHETVYSFTLGDKVSITDEKSNVDTNGESLLINSRGEFVLVVEGAQEKDSLLSTSIPEHVKFYINLGLSKNDAIKRVANERNVKKDTIYREVLKI